jgi:hypothetical protein
VLPLVTLKAVLELSPLNSTRVPPDKTGLALSEASPTLVPLETVEMVVLPDDPPELPPELHTLHAVMSKSQMPDPDVDSLKAKVYPFEVPLVLTRFAAATPVNTELSVVFKIELFVVDSEEIPKVVVPNVLVADSFPKLVVPATIML